MMISNQFCIISELHSCVFHFQDVQLIQRRSVLRILFFLQCLFELKCQFLFICSIQKDGYDLLFQYRKIVGILFKDRLLFFPSGLTQHLENNKIEIQKGKNEKSSKLYQLTNHKQVLLQKRITFFQYCNFVTSYIIIISLRNSIEMSYTNVVFNQNITRNVNRDQIEHQRIDDRVGFQSRFQTAGNLIFKPPEQSSLAVNQQQRFNKNHEANDRIKRQTDKEKQQNFYNARLQKRLSRQEEKWQKQSNKYSKEEEKRLYHQKVLIDNKKNSNAMGYNPITHAYEESKRGLQLKEYDVGKQVNRYVRAKNIIQKNNAKFNIITGQDKALVNQPIPENIRPRVQKKYEEKKEREAVKYVPIRDKYDYLDDN